MEEVFALVFYQRLHRGAALQSKICPEYEAASCAWKIVKSDWCCCLEKQARHGFARQQPVMARRLRVIAAGFALSFVFRQVIRSNFRMQLHLNCTSIGEISELGRMKMCI
jgi:hypothetical protein